MPLFSLKFLMGKIGTYENRDLECFMMWGRKLDFEFTIFCKKSKCKNFVRTAQFSIIKFRMLSLKAAFFFEVCWLICESSLLWSLQWQCMHVPAPRERVKPRRDRGKPRCHFPERENQRTAEEGRWVQVPLRAASPTAGCSGPHPISFGVSPWIEIPWPLCQPVQCLIAFAVRKVFLMFKRNILYFCSCPLSLGLLLGTAEKSLGPSSLLLPSGIHRHW